MTMDLEKYRVLLAVLKEGSLSGTAENYGYTVSGISRMITSLEKEQGFPLLHRQHDGVRATKELETLLPYMQELLYQEKIVLGMAEKIRGAALGTITIGIAYSSYYKYMADRAKAFQGMFPEVKFAFKNGYSSDLLEKLKTHEIDLCLISQREGHHAWRQVGEEEIVAWIPQNHRLSACERIPLSVFAEEPYIDIYPGKDIDNARLLKDSGIRLSSTISVQDSFAAYSMVDAGLGISLNHRSSCRKWNGDVLVKSLDPPIYIPVGLAANEKTTPVVEEFRKFIFS